MTSAKSILFAAIMGFCLPCICSVFYLHFHQSHRPVITAQAVNSEVVNSPTPTPLPTIAPTATIAPPTTKTYKDLDYNFKVSFPSSWLGVLNQKTELGLETYTIYSPNKSESLEILVSNGAWADVKLEIGPGSQRASFLGGPCLIRKNDHTTVYVFPSKTTGQVFRLTVTGNSSSITKIFKSFKLI